MKEIKEFMNVKKVRRKKMEKLGVGIAALFFVVFLISGLQFVLADSDPGVYSNESFSYDAAEINVTINTKTIIDVTPEVMNFGLLDPGSIGSVYNVTDGENNNIQLSKFEIENLGSTNIKHVWINVSQPDVRPFSTGNAANYDPGNWIAVNVSAIYSSNGNLPTNNAMSFVDRIEYNESKELVYLNVPSNTKSYGRLRIANNEYFWAINSSGATCDSSLYTVMLTLSDPNNPHNVTQTGDIDLANDDDNVYVSYSNVVQDGYSIPSLQATYRSNEVYLFLVSTDCSHIRVVKWNADAPGADKLDDNGYVYSDTTGLYPGDAIGMNIEIRVPYGVVASNYQGWMTILASSY